MRLVCSVFEDSDDDELVLATTESAIGASGNRDWSVAVVRCREEVGVSSCPCRTVTSEKATAKAQASFIWCTYFGVPLDECTQWAKFGGTTIPPNSRE